MQEKRDYNRAMLTKYKFLPIDLDNIAALDCFLQKAKFYIGDDDFTPGGRYAEYTYTDGEEIIGLLEIRLAKTTHLNSEVPGAVITKLATLGEDDIEAETLLLNMRREARKNGYGALYFLGEKLPFEDELELELCAPKGVYLSKGAEAAINELRRFNLNQEDEPGMVDLL